MGFISFSANQSVPGALNVGGQLTVDGNIVQSGGIFNLQNPGGIDINLAGGGVKIKQGTNATAGTGTLASGAATVSTTAVQAGAAIFLVATSTSAASGVLSVGTITAGTGFTVASSNSSDANTFAWLIINPG